MITIINIINIFIILLKGYFSIQDNFRLCILANGDRLEELIEKIDVPFEYFEVIKITKTPEEKPYFLTLYRRYPLDLSERYLFIYKLYINYI